MARDLELISNAQCRVCGRSGSIGQRLTRRHGRPAVTLGWLIGSLSFAPLALGAFVIVLRVPIGWYVDAKAVSCYEAELRAIPGLSEAEVKELADQLTEDSNTLVPRRYGASISRTAWDAWGRCSKGIGRLLDIGRWAWNAVFLALIPSVFALILLSKKKVCACRQCGAIQAELI